MTGIDLDRIRSNHVQRCVYCGIPITAANDSGWEAFVGDGSTTQPVCAWCDAMNSSGGPKEEEKIMTDELSGYKLNRAIADLLGFQIEQGAKDDLINPIIQRWEWILYSSAPNEDEPRTWLGSVMAETEEQAWREGWDGDLHWLPDWAHDANAALELCLREIQRLESVLIEHCELNPCYVASIMYDTACGARERLSQAGVTPAEALARLALVILREKYDGK